MCVVVCGASGVCSAGGIYGAGGVCGDGVGVWIVWGAVGAGGVGVWRMSVETASKMRE